MEKYTLGAHLVHISKYKFCNITYLLPYDRKQSSLSMPHQHSHKTNMGNLPWGTASSACWTWKAGCPAANVRKGLIENYIDDTIILKTIHCIIIKVLNLN